MSFFKCLVTILGTANLQFEDEEAVRKAFQEQFGAEGDRFGLEDQEDESPNALLQLESVARMLDCKVRVSAEVSPSAQPSSPINSSRWSESAGVINPTGTQQGWARWTSSAREAIEPIPRYTFGSVSQPPIVMSVGGDLLKDLGWPDLLKGLVRCKGDLAETLLLMREDLNQEMEASAADNPVVIARASRLGEILIELEEKAKLQAAVVAEETTPNIARGSSPSVPSSPKRISLSNKSHPFHSPVSRPSVPPAKGISSTTEQAFLERLMEASVNNNVHSMVSVGSLPTLKGSSLEAIESFTKDYFTSVASKTFNSANKSLHPIRGLTSDNYKVLQLIWNGTKLTQSLGSFASSDAVEPLLWLRSLQEAVRVAQRAPKVGEKLELEKTSNGSPKIDEYIVRLQRHFEHHDNLTIEKKLELATKGLKKHFKHLGTFVEDTAIPDEKARCEKEKEAFTIETALFIILKEFRSYMGAKQSSNSHSSDESSDDESSVKKAKKHSKKRKLRNDKESGSSNSNNSRKNPRDKDKADPKDKGSRNNGDETGKPTCHICKSEDHLMNDCPDFDPNFKKNKKSKVLGETRLKIRRNKGQFNMIRGLSKPGLFCGKCKLEDSEELVVQFDTGAEDGNYCSEEFAKLAESKGSVRQPSDHSVKLADGKTALCLTHEIEVTITLCFTNIGREDKQIKVRCAILPTLPYMLTLGAIDISTHDLLSDLAVLAAFKKQGYWNAIKGSSESVAEGL